MKELSRRQYRTLYAGSVGVLVAGIVADMATTYVGLSWFPVSEANPTAQLAMNSFGRVGGMVALSIFLLLAVIALSLAFNRVYDGWTGRWGSISMVAIAGAVKLLVAWWNTTQILLAV
jgi:membrane-bound metal-dependent hydrolase YbcI (DUF457 family)